MTPDETKTLRKYLDKKFGIISDRFDNCDGRFNNLDERLNGVEERMNEHVAGPGTKRTATTGGVVAAVVSSIVVGIIEAVRRLGQ